MENGMEESTKSMFMSLMMMAVSLCGRYDEKRDVIKGKF